MTIPLKPSRWVLMDLSCRDLWHDKKISLCMVAAVISVVAPLLLLFGLKQGVVSQMRDALARQPGNLEIRMIGTQELTDAWFESMRRDPRVGYLVPMTRALNTVADLRSSDRTLIPDVELLPSGRGDPLLFGQPEPLGDDQIWLSSAAAQRLSATTGGSLQLIVSRRRDGQLERLIVPVKVQGILEPAAFSRPAALITLNLLTALEDFRDGATHPEPGIYRFGTTATSRTHYPRARLYARSIDDVPGLALDLQKRRIDTVSRLAEIQAMQAVDRLLGLVFGVIAWLGVAGCAASLMGAFAANIDRKRRDLALLRLIGYGRRALLGYVAAQAVVIATVGFGIGAALYAGGSYFFDSVLGRALPDSQYVSQLGGLQALLAFCLALSVALIVSLLSGWMAMRVEPSESMRHV